MLVSRLTLPVINLNMLRHVRYFSHPRLDFLSPFCNEVRCYARGTRFFDQQDVPGQRHRDDHSLKDSGVQSKTPIKQLLENATVSEKFRGAGSPADNQARLKNGYSKRNQANHSYRPEVDPSETSIILFPGQGLILCLPIKIESNLTSMF